MFQNILQTCSSSFISFDNMRKIKKTFIAYDKTVYLSDTSVLTGIVTCIKIFEYIFFLQKNYTLFGKYFMKKKKEIFKQKKKIFFF